MLCKECKRYFSFDDPYVVQQLVDAKTEHLRVASGRNLELVKELNQELTRYGNAQNEHVGDAICPWRPNISSTPSAQTRNIDMGTYIDYPASAKPQRKLSDLKANMTDPPCDLCKRLLAMIEYAGEDRLLEDDIVDATIKVGKWDCRPQELVFLLISHTAGLSFHFDIFLNDHAFDCPVGEPLGNSTDAEECMATLRRSYEQCVQEHPACQPRQDHWFPTRLLDVSPNKGGVSAVRLREKTDILAEEAEFKVQYVSLSHMWGTQRHLVTNQANYHQFLAGIEENILPRCFLDAVRVTRKFGLRYLWIDSLCIIQDSSIDWAKEALTMGDVYQYGVFNIAACESTASDISLFTHRNPRLGAPFTVEQQFADVKVTYTVCPNWTRLSRQSCALYTRGWVVQERFLSRRLLLFTKYPAWECSTVLQNEVLRKVVRTNGKRAVTNDNDAGERDFIYPEKTESHRERSWRWRQLVTSYSRSDLTFTSDKLIAFAGLAKHFSSSLQQAYHAGIWGGDLLHSCLLWKIDYNKLLGGGYSDRPEKYQAPSWSWASINAHIDMFEQDVEETLAELVEINTLPAHEDVFGAVKFGELVMKGKLLELPDLASHQADLGDTWLTLDEEPAKIVDRRTFFMPLVKLDVEEEEEEEEEDGNNEFRGFATAAGILLQSVSIPHEHASSLDPPQATYSRIGYAEISNSGHFVLADLIEVVDLAVIGHESSWWDAEEVEVRII